MKKLLLVTVIICDILFCAAAYSISINHELSDNLLRLHVIANSSSPKDIAVKFAVRDMINEYIENKNLSDKTGVYYELNPLTEKINIFLSDNGIDYQCRLIKTVSYFPAKKYDNIKMPSGKYDCIKATLGNGEGENWWCIAYPPLCFTEAVTGNLSANGEEKLKERLSDEAYKLIHADSRGYNIRFFAVDLINNILNK